MVEGVLQHPARDIDGPHPLDYTPNRESVEGGLLSGG